MSEWDRRHGVIPQQLSHEENAGQTHTREKFADLGGNHFPELIQFLRSGPNHRVLYLSSALACFSLLGPLFWPPPFPVLGHFGLCAVCWVLNLLWDPRSSPFLYVKSEKNLFCPLNSGPLPCCDHFCSTAETLVPSRNLKCICLVRARSWGIPENLMPRT